MEEMNEIIKTVLEDSVTSIDVKLVIGDAICKSQMYASIKWWMSFMKDVNPELLLDSLAYANKVHSDYFEDTLVNYKEKSGKDDAVLAANEYFSMLEVRQSDRNNIRVLLSYLLPKYLNVFGTYPTGDTFKIIVKYTLQLRKDIVMEDDLLRKYAYIEINKRMKEDISDHIIDIVQLIGFEETYDRAVDNHARNILRALEKLPNYGEELKAVKKKYMKPSNLMNKTKVFISNIFKSKK